VYRSSSVVVDVVVVVKVVVKVVVVVVVNVEGIVLVVEDRGSRCRR
jgi:hypothetical protein